MNPSQSESGDVVIPVRETRGDPAHGCAGAGDENHVGVRRQDPAIRGIRAAHRCVAGDRLQCLEVGPPLVSLVHGRANAQDTEPAARLIGQRVGDRFRERRKIVGRVVVDEQDLVGGIVEQLRHAVEADGGPLVQVVAVVIVSAV